MSLYLEIPQLNLQFPYRAFLNDGMTIVYPHWHKEIEIIYASRGQVKIGVDDMVVELQEGEIFFFASGEPHYFLASPDSERYVYQFDLKFFDETYEKELIKITKIKALQGEYKGLYRLRLRTYRLIYEKQNDKLVILVLRVSHRKDIY